MSGSSAWVAMKAKDYNSLRKKYPDYELINEVNQDGLYDILESYGLGGGFVYDEPFDSEWEKAPDYVWFSSDQGRLKLEKLETGDVMIWFPSAKAKHEWFQLYFVTFRKRLIDELAKLTIENYSDYNVCDPAWRIKEAYSGCWYGRVLTYDGKERMSDFDTPMNFLRQMKPREKWVIAGKEWRYK